MVKKKKILFFVYCLLVSALSIGWYPQNQNKQVRKDITSVRKSSEKMAALVENNQFCYQGVAETDMDERRMNTQEDEKQRRTVKTIVRYRVNLDHGARRILERIVEAESGDQTIKGRQMVANVILNRMKSEKFPNSVREIVFAGRQFSPVSNGSYYRVKVSSQTKKAVEKALKEKDNTNGALYFMYRAGSDSSNVSWFDRELTKLCEYGCHEFFR
ncbi:MAG: cell wall hydrolase [Clostridium sp.]|jgi:cell wall hydrolase sleB